MKNKINQTIENVVEETLEKTLSERFERYAKYVIQQRALPDVRDGLKPVQRRILYSMFTLGLDPDKPYKKSARVVGDVIGKYHPHGDFSVYEAMVNLSQWWKMNLPILDMHGNIGSIDNDPAAQMRYTEVRLSKVAQYMIGDIKKKTTLFVPNFDDSEQEPLVLPSLFPNLLVNGAMGIAVGMATNMLPHNLNEIIDASIYKIKNPQTSLKSLMKYIQGPDFPTGGIIHGTNGIIEGFETGNNSTKNKIKLFSKYNVYTKGQYKYIEITEIPYGVIKSSLVYSIDEIIQNKAIAGLLEIKDQSDRSGINILLVLEKDVNDKSIISYLFEKTKLQNTYNYNQVVIINGRPKLASLLDLLDNYILHVKDVKSKVIKFDLEKSKLRLEIILGLLKVTEITDEVIALIRNCEGSKSGVINALMLSFNFTENQATAIAELRLYKLSKTDKEALLDEKAQLIKNIEHYELLLNDEVQFNEYVINELKSIKKLFGKERKTQIIQEDFNFTYHETDLIKEEVNYVGITKQGFIKKFSDKTVVSNSLSTYPLKDNDVLKYFNKLNSMNTLLIFTNFGNYIQVPVYKINECKWRETGQKLSDLVDLKVSEEVVSVIKVDNWNSNTFIVIGTKNGLFKKVKLTEFKVQRLNKVYNAINLTNDDKVINVALSNGLYDILILTKNGLCSLYSENDIAIYSPKAKGNKGVYLSLSDKVENFAMVQNNDIVSILTAKGQIKHMLVSKLTYVPKSIKGKKIIEVFESKIIDLCPGYNLKAIGVNGNMQSFLEEINLSSQTKHASITDFNIPSLLEVSFLKLNDESKSISTKLFTKESIQNDELDLQKTEQKIKESSLKLEELLKKLNK